MKLSVRKIIKITLGILLVLLPFVTGMFVAIMVDYNPIVSVMAGVMILILLLCIFVTFMSIAELDKMDRHIVRRGNYIKKLERILYE